MRQSPEFEHREIIRFEAARALKPAREVHWWAQNTEAASGVTLPLQVSKWARARLQAVSSATTLAGLSCNQNMPGKSRVQGSDNVVGLGCVLPKHQTDPRFQPGRQKPQRPPGASRNAGSRDPMRIYTLATEYGVSQGKLNLGRQGTWTLGGAHSCVCFLFPETARSRITGDQIFVL